MIAFWIVTGLYLAISIAVATAGLIQWSTHSTLIDEHPKGYYARSVILSPLWPIMAWSKVKELLEDAQNAK